MQTPDVRDAAQSAVNQSKSFVGRQIEARTMQLGADIAAFAGDLRSISRTLRASDTVGLGADYVDRGAATVDRVADYLKTAPSERLMGDLEGLARRQPWSIAAGALVAGFAASRFLKTSSTRRFRTTSRYAATAVDAVSKRGTLYAS